MVLCVGIGFYQQDWDHRKNEVGGYLDNLPGVRHDVLHMHKLFGSHYGYDVFPPLENGEKPITKWNECDLQDFLEGRARHLAANIKEGKMYDALVVIISCHGIPGYICTSDHKKYSKLAIHRTFAWHAEVREIPRFVLFDCCQGNDSPVAVRYSQLGLNKNVLCIEEMKENDEHDKRVEPDDIFNGDKNGQKWTSDTRSPDHLLG